MRTHRFYLWSNLNPNRPSSGSFPAASSLPMPARSLRAGLNDIAAQQGGDFGLAEQILLLQHFDEALGQRFGLGRATGRRREFVLLRRGRRPDPILERGSLPVVEIH